MPIASSVAKCGRASRMLSSSAAVSAQEHSVPTEIQRHDSTERYEVSLCARLTDVTFCDDEDVSLGRESVEDGGVVLR